MTWLRLPLATLVSLGLASGPKSKKTEHRVGPGYGVVVDWLTWT
jgi:hypothetical protein